VSFRRKLFLALALVSVLAVTLVAVLTAGPLARATSARIDRTLASEARLAAELLSQVDATPAMAGLDTEADRIGGFVDARVTFIAADGRVVGDSAEPFEGLASLENHGQRPEVLEALAHGFGRARRYSTTVRTDMLYVAVPTRHPAVSVVRLALPLTEIQAQVAVVRRAMAAALGVATLVALALAWVLSSLLSARLQRLTAAARRYAAGDRLEPAGEGKDEIGQLGRALHDAIRALADRMTELDQSRGRLEAILAGMIEGVIVADADGRVRLVNDSARRMLGLPAQAGEPERYLHAIRHPDVVRQFDAAFSGRVPEDVELVLPGGSTVVARAVPLAHGSAVLVLHDISRLRHADQVRRDFVANVSHELRTPLTAIQGYAEELRDPALAPADRDRFLDVIDRHTARMTRLVEDLLRLARLDSGQEGIVPAPCRVAAIFEHVAADLRPRLGVKRQQLTTAVEDGAAAIVTDAARLEEVLRNLVDNAISYAPEGTTIHLEAARRGDRVELRVLDEGPGLPPEDLARIFERFYRVDKARSTASGGTGLGLSIVKHLVERLGGTVEAGNRPIRGAVFTVRLPAGPSDGSTGSDGGPT
jgi:two-component system phosphate regulon sensor histidine kinase PhoR